MGGILSSSHAHSMLEYRMGTARTLNVLLVRPKTAKSPGESSQAKTALRSSAGRSRIVIVSRVRADISDAEVMGKRM